MEEEILASGADSVGLALPEDVRMRPGGTFLQTGIYTDFGVLDRLFDEGFRFEENVDDISGKGSYSVIGNGTVSYGICLDYSRNKDDEQAFMVVARREAVSSMPDYDIGARRPTSRDFWKYRMPGEDVSATGADRKAVYVKPDIKDSSPPRKNGKHVKLSQDAEGVETEDPTEHRVNGREVSREKKRVPLNLKSVYDRHELELMGYLNHGAAGTYLFDNGGPLLYPGKETWKNSNNYRITGVVSAPWRAEGQSTTSLKKGASVLDNGTYTHDHLLVKGLKRQLIRSGNSIEVYTQGDLAYVMKGSYPTNMKLLRILEFRLKKDSHYSKEVMEGLGMVQEYPLVFTASGGKERYRFEIDESVQGNAKYVLKDRYWIRL